jgi:sigma-B regulation protein RsbU (phosphoserine phosphatase)
MNEDPEHARRRNAVKLERLELALKASNEGIWDWKIDEDTLYYSRRILEFLECGKDRAPNLFTPPHQHIHPDEQRAFGLAVSQALAIGGPDTLAADARVRTGSGEWRWLRIRGTVVRNREGHAFRIAGSIINISRRKAAEAQVEDERFLLRQLIDHIPLQIYFKDLDSRFTQANQRMAEWMGLNHESELIGKHDRDFFEPDHWQPAERDEKNIIATGSAIVDQLEHETWHQGNDSWVITSKFPWRDRHGQIKGTFGVSSDVTKLVTAEREALDLANQLQQKNAAFEEELLLAREIQQALAGEGFPVATARDQSKISFGARYIPISGLAGDFFEVMKVHDDCYGVLICDVMGHGVRSALIVAMLRGLLEKQRAQADRPGLFLQGLNDGLASILERAGTTMFATAFFGLLDATAGTFSYACAGHPGPVISGRNGVRQIACERIQKGPGLGLIRGAVYPTNEIDLKEIDRMVLFTDGVLEAENQSGEPFFENRLMEIIGKKSAEPMEDLLDGILTSVLAFSESQHFDDDVCLLGIEVVRQPVPSPIRTDSRA